MKSDEYQDRELFIPLDPNNVKHIFPSHLKNTENLGWYSAMYDVTKDPKIRTHACNCIGSQRGQPLCPCQMSSVREVDGRYVQIIDHGSVSKDEDLEDRLKYYFVGSRKINK